MITRLVAAAAALLLVGTATQVATGPATALPAPEPNAAVPTRLMVVGDSLSQGLEGDFTWRYRLDQHLAGDGVETDFVGPWTGTHRVADRLPAGFPEVATPPVRDGLYRPGLSFPDSEHLSQWGWQATEARGAVADPVRTHQPDYLLVELGFNDLALGLAPTALAGAVREIVTNARAARPDVTVLVANVVHRSPVPNRPELAGRISAYNQQLAELVPALSRAGSPVALVDLDRVFDHTVHTYDGLHPNVRGEVVIAKAFADVLSAGFGLGSGFGAVPASLPADLRPGGAGAVSVERSGLGLRVSWPHVFGASGYRLFRRDLTAGGPFEPYPYAVGADSWTDPRLAAGHRYAFHVRTVRGDHVAEASPVGEGVVAPLPLVPGVTVTTSPARPYTATVRWKPVAGADDYHVYAFPDCLQIGTEHPGFKLAQFGLGGRTSWTQEFVTSTCAQYVVVASRLNGEGARPREGIRVRPYRPNHWHHLARDHFLDSAPDSGDQRAETRIPAGPDRGIVVARGFIADKSAFTNAIGDKRGFDAKPFSSAKMAVAWDTRTGEIGVYVHRSCVPGYRVPFVDKTLVCKGARPVRFVADATRVRDGNKAPYNFVSVRRSGQGLALQVSAINSFETQGAPGLGRIHATVLLVPRAGAFDVRLVADRFPSWEFLRYPRASVSPAAENVGAFAVLGTRDQTGILDLQGSPLSVCRSRGEIPQLAFKPRPMSC